MSEAKQIQSILEAIGYLAEITLGQVGGNNDSGLRLNQINRIIQWTQQIKQNIEAEHNLRLQFEEEIHRLESTPTRIQLLTAMDTAIQGHMRELNVNIAVGTQLLPRVMEVIELNIMILIQEIDAKSAEVNKLASLLDEANFKLAEFEEQKRLSTSGPQIEFVKSQFVTTSQDVVSPYNQIECLQNELVQANAKKLEYEGIIERLETDNAKLTQQLNQARGRNGELVQQIKLSNSKIEQFEAKIFKSQSKVDRVGFMNSSTNDANIQIISELKSQLNKSNERINQLVQQIIDANSKAEELQKRLQKKGGIASPVQEVVQTRTTVLDPRVKQLQTELISKQEEINQLNTSVRSADAKINQLINELMSANGELLIFKNKLQSAGNPQEKDQIIFALNSQIEQLRNQYTEAGHRIAELEQSLERNYDRKEHISQAHQTANVQLATKLMYAEQKNADLINQVAIANNRITDLQLDLQNAGRQKFDQNTSPHLQRDFDSVTHALMVAESKVKEMMKIVANYQNNVIDLELDKEALGIQLNDARNKQQDYLDELKVERASVTALKEQVIKLKEGYRGIARDNLRQIEDEIAGKPQGRANEPVHGQAEKSERSFRGHKKIFEGEVRGSRASNHREANVQK